MKKTTIKKETKKEQVLICDNCKDCPVLKYCNKRLMEVYDWSSGSLLPMFRDCGRKGSFFYKNNNPNIRCFTKTYAKALNWKELKKYYLENKEEIDEELDNLENDVDSD